MAMAREDFLTVTKSGRLSVGPRTAAALAAKEALEEAVAQGAPRESLAEQLRQARGHVNSGCVFLSSCSPFAHHVKGWSRISLSLRLSLVGRRTWQLGLDSFATFPLIRSRIAVGKESLKGKKKWKKLTQRRRSLSCRVRAWRPKCDRPWKPCSAKQCCWYSLQLLIWIEGSALYVNGCVEGGYFSSSSREAASCRCPCHLLLGMGPFHLSPNCGAVLAARAGSMSSCCHIARCCMRNHDAAYVSRCNWQHHAAMMPIA